MSDFNKLTDPKYSRLRRDILNAAFAKMSPAEQALLERHIERLTGIKNLGRETALEVLAAIGRQMDETEA